jgi:carbon storage regulator
MLVLRRKVGESIVLAGVINISVLAVEGERVKIGISAPPDITIVREELLRAPVTDTAPGQGQGSSISPASQR